MHQLDDEALVATLLRLGGLSDAIVTEPELLSMVLPALRGDLALFADYRATDARLPMPIVAMSGTRDPLADVRSQAGWQRYASHDLQLRVFDGGHFFLHDSPDAVMRELNDVMGNLDES